MVKPKNVTDLASQTENSLTFDTKVKGIDFDKNVNLDDIIKFYKTTGFQSSNLYQAIQIIREMQKTHARIFFGATSNITTSGLREIIRYLVKNKKIDVYVTTGGGIEEDIIKCAFPTKVGQFSLDGKRLRSNGLNRAGNLIIGNDGYAFYEKWINKLLDRLTHGYTPENPLIMTPSSFIKEMGKEINDENSILYWCYKNEIPVYSPAILDGSTGDIFTFYASRESIKIDLVEDIRNINFECFNSELNGAIIVGSGLVKHHILNANLFKNGLDFCVLLNTAVEYDGSDSGALISEAHSWGKIKPESKSVKISGEASIIFPLLIYGAFVSKHNFE